MRGVEDGTREQRAHHAAGHLEARDPTRDLTQVAHTVELGGSDRGRHRAHAGADAEGDAAHVGTPIRGREREAHACDDAGNGTQDVTGPQAELVVDGAERDLGDHHRHHVDAHDGTRPGKAVAARDDLLAVDGHARHVGHLVAEHRQVHDAHEHEGAHEQPERRMTLDDVPAGTIARGGELLGRGSVLGRLLGNLLGAVGLKPDVRGTGVKGEGGDGEARHKADERERKERRTPAVAHDDRAHDGREHRAAKAGARERDGDGKAALGREPVGRDERDEQARAGDHHHAGDGDEHVELPRRGDEREGHEHERGDGHREAAEHPARDAVGQDTHGGGAHDAHQRGDGTREVVLREGEAQVLDDIRLEERDTVDERGVAGGHDEEAGGHHEPAGKDLVRLGCHGSSF